MSPARVLCLDKLGVDTLKSGRRCHYGGDYCIRDVSKKTTNGLTPGGGIDQRRDVSGRRRKPAHLETPDGKRPRRRRRGFRFFLPAYGNRIPLVPYVQTKLRKKLLAATKTQRILFFGTQMMVVRPLVRVVVPATKFPAEYGGKRTAGLTLRIRLLELSILSAIQ